jgi:hypothetical protein
MNKNNLFKHLYFKNNLINPIFPNNSSINTISKTEDNCMLVSSRGILKSSQIHSDSPISSITQLKGYNFKNINNTDILPTIYICSSALLSFKNIINQIKYSFILITGDSDTSISNDLPFDFNEFIENDKIIHMYAQNAIIKHHKLTQIPIGLDYHTLSNTNHDWGNQQTPIEQEKLLLEIKNNSKSFWEREIKCYSNFHFSLNGQYCYDRHDAIKQINKNLVFYEPVKLTRIQSWKNQSNYAFVLSPHGNGLDCHRTWEAFCLGNIPIVKTSPLDTLYDDLPILIVVNWSDITSKLLEETIIKFKAKNLKIINDKLTLKYWINKINFSQKPIDNILE